MTYSVIWTRFLVYSFFWSGKDKMSPSIHEQETVSRVVEIPAAITPVTLTINEYLTKECQSMKDRQRKLQEEFQEKQRQMQGIKETLLVISGAIQAIEHVMAHVSEAEVPS